MKVFAALTIAAFAGSAVAQPIAPTTVHRRSVSDLNGTHYKEAYDAAHLKYLQHKSASERASSLSKWWAAVAQANKEAFDAYGTKEDHRHRWETHANERAALFHNTFVVPKNESFSSAEEAYNSQQLEYDLSAATLKAEHTARKVAIEQGLADNQKGIEDTKYDIGELSSEIENKKEELANYQANYYAHEGKLAKELATYNASWTEIRANKEQLAREYGLWKDDHEKEWESKENSWNTNRDKEEQQHEENHNTAFSQWLKEKLGADVSNGYCPCINGGTCTDNLGDVEMYECNCPTGYTGVDCEIDIDHCTSSPCKNGGACVDGVLTHTCHCLAGTSGPNCETIEPIGHTVTFKTFDGTKDQIYVDGYGYLPASCIDETNHQCTITVDSDSLTVHHLGGGNDGWSFQMKGDVGHLKRIESKFQKEQRYKLGNEESYGSVIIVDSDQFNQVVEFAWAE